MVPEILIFCHVNHFCSFGNLDSVEGFWVETNGMHTRGYNSSSNSNNSSFNSISGSSSDSDYKMTTGTGDLEADADSLTCRQSGLSYNNQLQNEGPKLVLFPIFINQLHLFHLCYEYSYLLMTIEIVFAVQLYYYI